MLLRIFIFVLSLLIILVLRRSLGVIFVFFVKLFNLFRLIIVYFLWLMLVKLCLGRCWNKGICFFLNSGCILLLEWVFWFLWFLLVVLLLLELILWFMWLCVLCEFFEGFNLWSFIRIFFYLINYFYCFLIEIKWDILLIILWIVVLFLWIIVWFVFFKLSVLIVMCWFFGWLIIFCLRVIFNLVINIFFLF